MLAPWKKRYDKPRQHIKKQRPTVLTEYSQSYGFSSSHVWMWELIHKEGWALKNWCFLFFFPFIFISLRLITLQYCSGFCHTLTWISLGSTCVPHPDPPSRLTPHRCFLTEVLEKTLESPLDCKDIILGNPKGNQSWIVIRRTDAEAEIPILWPPDAKSQLIGKNPLSGKDWRREEKGKTEVEIIGWYHQLNGHEFEETLWDGEGQGSLVCCSPWGQKRVRHGWAIEQQQQGKWYTAWIL